MEPWLRWTIGLIVISGILATLLARVAMRIRRVQRGIGVASNLRRLKKNLGCGGKCELIQSFVPEGLFDALPTEKLGELTRFAPNLYMLLAIELDEPGHDPHDAELLARGWINATIGAACEKYAINSEGRHFRDKGVFDYRLAGSSDHCLRVKNDMIRNPRWQVKWGKSWWDSIQVVAADQPDLDQVLGETATTGIPDVRTRVWLAIGTPAVDVAQFAADPSGNTLYDYASAMEAIRRGYVELFNGQRIKVT